MKIISIILLFISFSLLSMDEGSRHPNIQYIHYNSQKGFYCSKSDFQGHREWSFDARTLRELLLLNINKGFIAISPDSHYVFLPTFEKVMPGQSYLQKYFRLSQNGFSALIQSLESHSSQLHTRIKEFAQRSAAATPQHLLQVYSSSTAAMQLPGYNAHLFKLWRVKALVVAVQNRFTPAYNQLLVQACSPENQIELTTRMSDPTFPKILHQRINDVEKYLQHS